MDAVVDYKNKVPKHQCLGSEPNKKQTTASALALNGMEVN